MNIKKTLKISFLVLLFVAVVAYLLYVFFGMESTNPDEECVEVTITIEDGTDAFVDSLMVMDILKESGIYPIGKKMRDINPISIKNLLEKNPFITTVDCYQTNNGMPVGTGKLCVRVNERIPVLLVFEDNSSYYVDALANVIRTDTIYAKNVLVANGEISNNYLAELVELAQFIKTDEFWDNQIEQVFVSKNNMKQRVITLIPRVGSQKIFLGTIDDYDKKLKRLRKFYERGLNTIGWNKYSILNLEYKDQVVGVIKGKEIVLDEDDASTSEKDKNDKTGNNDNTTDEKPKSEEPKKDESKKDEPKNEETRQTDSNADVTNKEEPKKEEIKKGETNKEETR